MRIGVISDTHNHLANVAQIVRLLNDAGVDRVIHTGDITQPKTLRALAGLRAPLHGVYGNNDEREALRPVAQALGCTFAEERLELAWAERRIVVVHDPRDLTAVPLARGDVAIHGHVHRLVIEDRAGALIFNPGECAGHMAGQNAIGVLDLRTLHPELLRF